MALPSGLSLQQSDGFTIEDCIIKGGEKFFPVDADNLGEQLLKSLDKRPERIWQIDSATGEETTYKVLKERSIRLAIWLRNEGIVAGDIVSLCSPNHQDIGSIILGTIFVGATYNAWPMESNLRLARYLVNFIKPRIMFACKDKAELLQEAADLENHAWKMIVLDKDRLDDMLDIQLSDEIDKFPVPATISSAHPTIIMPTSGTTGILKFVCYSNERFMRWISNIDMDTELKNTNIVCLEYLSPEWELHFRSMLHNIVIGRTQVFHREFDSNETCKIIEEFKVNTLALDVYLATLLCQSDAADNYDVQSVLVIKTCGSRISPAVVKKLRKNFYNANVRKIYGSTETYILTNFTKNCCNPESQGSVIANVQLKISDVKTGSALGPNDIGEIRVKTPFGMNGYYKNLEASKLAFDEEGWFCMGDQGYYDENGEIVIVGRLKEMIRYRLYDIYPSHIEELLMSHPSVVDVAAVGILHETDIEHPVVFVKIAPETVVTEDDVLKLLCELEYSDAFKDSVIFADEIPRSRNGKINRRILRERAEKFYADLIKRTTDGQE